MSASKWGRTEAASGRKAAARNRLTIQSARLQSRRRTAGNSRHRRGRQNSQTAIASRLPNMTISGTAKRLLSWASYCGVVGGPRSIVGGK